MMIKKIETIQNFGPFLNYSWNCKEFQQFNLLFGWNYSGKTTLSRLFRSFQEEILPEHYESATFKICCDNGAVYTEEKLSTPLSIRVFNEDFVKENLCWDESSANPFIILGKENVELMETLRKKNDEYKNMVNDNKIRSDKVEEMGAQLDREYINKARDIKKTLNILGYNKANLKSLIEEIKDNPGAYLLDQETFSRIFLKYNNKSKLSKIPPISRDIGDIHELYEEIQTLSSKIVETESIQSLVDDPKLNKWIKEGVELHKNNTICKFCGQTLIPDIIQKYLRHFSDDYEIFQSKLENIKKKLTKIHDDLLLINIPDKGLFYSDLSETGFEKLRLFPEQVKKYDHSISTLITAVEIKSDNLFKQLTVDPIEYNYNELRQSIDTINHLISTHNTRIECFDTEQSEAKDKLLKSYAAEFVQDRNVIEVEQDIKIIRGKLILETKTINELKNEIREISNKLAKGAVGAKTINDYLEIFFAKEDIKIHPETEDNKFYLYRKDKKAYNLSLGEKTAISFAYFIAKLNDEETKLNETIVYIDDPISSLDSRHLFDTYSLIKNIFYKREKIGNNVTHKCKCEQLFISTHNHEFFNLIHDWFKKIKNNQVSYYLIKKLFTATTDESKLTDIPDILKNHKSEYSYLFKILYDFNMNPVEDYEQLYDLPNLSRRFLESYLAFKYQSFNLDEDINKLITDDILCEKTRKFIHSHSHGMDIGSMIKLCDLSECISVVDIIFTSLNERDSEHYDALVAEASRY